MTVFCAFRYSLHLWGFFRNCLMTSSLLAHLSCACQGGLPCHSVPFPFSHPWSCPAVGPARHNAVSETHEIMMGSCGVEFFINHPIRTCLTMVSFLQHVRKDPSRASFQAPTVGLSGLARELILKGQVLVGNPSPDFSFIKYQSSCLVVII